MPPLVKSLLPPLICVLLLGALHAETRYLRVAPEEAGRFHQRAKAAADAMPVWIGDWVGHDVEMPPAAVTLLRPNVLMSRTYVNWRSGREAQVVLVQCRDARDMVGHFPPNCYPGQGWTTESAQPFEWQVGEELITGVEYEFSSDVAGRTGKIAIANFMVLPDGKFARGMAGVNRIAADARKRHFGAAQVQVLMEASVSAEQRRQIVRELLEANLPIIRAMQEGVEP